MLALTIRKGTQERRIRSCRMRAGSGLQACGSAKEKRSGQQWGQNLPFDSDIIDWGYKEEEKLTEKERFSGRFTN